MSPEHSNAKKAHAGLHSTPQHTAAEGQKSRHGNNPVCTSSKTASPQPDQATAHEQMSASATNGSHNRQLARGTAVGRSSPAQPSSAPPNSYLARLGRAAQSMPAARSCNPAAADVHSSSPGPAARSGNAGANRPSSPSHSPAAKSGTASHAAYASAAPRQNQSLHDSHVRGSQSPKQAAARQTSSSSSPLHGRLSQSMSVGPNFVQTLRDWGLGPRTSAPLTQPMWQPYQRHVTPERDSARQGLARKALAQKALALQKLSSSTNSGLVSDYDQNRSARRTSGSPQTVQTADTAKTRNSSSNPQRSNRVPWDSAVRDKSDAVGRPTEGVAGRNPNSYDITSDTLSAPVALKPRVGQLWGRSASPSHAKHMTIRPFSASQSHVGLMPERPSSASVPHDRHKAPQPSSASEFSNREMRTSQHQHGRDAAAQAGPKPFRAGQLATAALQTKQAAWEHTRTQKLPSLLSQVTELLHCNSESLLLVPERSATELMYAASPQLGQYVPPAAARLTRGLDSEEESAQYGTTAVAMPAQDSVLSEPESASGITPQYSPPAIRHASVFSFVFNIRTAR